MTAVPSRGFVGCESLTELTLPASIQDCGVTDTSVAFNDCTSLQNIYVADGSLYFKMCIRDRARGCSSASWTPAWM